jgi:hypothetical protein
VDFPQEKQTCDPHVYNPVAFHKELLNASAAEALPFSDGQKKTKLRINSFVAVISFFRSWRRSGILRFS